LIQCSEIEKTILAVFFDTFELAAGYYSSRFSDSKKMARFPRHQPIIYFKAFGDCPDVISDSSGHHRSANIYEGSRRHPDR